jgi:putative hemolysin
MIRRARCPVSPVYFRGRNGLLFQALGQLHPRIRTAMLARELLGRRRSTIEVRIGSTIPFRQLDACGSAAEMTAYLRSRTEILAERPPRVGVGGKPIQPRVTPANVRPLIPALSVDRLVDEIENLPPDGLLVDGADQVIYVAEASRIPTVVREIGRLREISFREVGEGTGREVDLDHFDETYLHLFIWSKANRQVVGAYRIGMIDQLMQHGGLKGLYTSTLFDFKPRLFEVMGRALEMGRSFIRPEYQKSYAGLVLLWKGIGQFVLRNPDYATLFGPVSISADYQTASQRLLVAFLQQNNYVHEWSGWVRPRTPCRPDRRTSRRLGPLHMRTLEDVSSFIAEIEADHKGVPILLRQYLKLGGRLLGFNVDPNFSNVLDVLIMVDLRRTEKNVLSRYMGRKGVEALHAHHRTTRSEAS